ncbi:MAG TPA: DUF4340 domain-containing protein [Verrucomicrobiae bacterium]|jgi:hypothetical protein
MNRKQLILLVVALVIIGGACLVLLQHNQKSWTEPEAQIGQKLFKNYQVNDVASINIKGDADLTLNRKDGGWQVEQRGGYPANMSQIRELLLKLGDLKVAQSDPIGASQLPRMHLAEPGKGPDSAVLLELKDAQGKAIESLLLGKKHTHEGGQAQRAPFGGDEGFADGRYVMLSSDPKTVLTISDALNNVDPKPAEWLDKDFFKVEKLQSVSFVSTNSTNSWKVSRAAETAPWVLADIKPGEVFDTNKVSSLNSSLSYPSFVDVAPDQAPDKTGLDKPLTVTIETFDHFTYTLKVGHKTPENNYNLNVAVTADIPTARVAGKDEKPDDKAKMDKVFEDNAKVQQDKLNKDKALAKWTYLVNNWLVDPFIRDRSQLMVDKDAGKKEAAPGAETTTEPEPPNLTPELPK